MNDDIIRQICVRDKLKARAKHSALASTMYKRSRNRVVKLITNAKSNYFKEKIAENKNNTRNLWKLLKQSAPTKPTSKAPSAILVNGEHVTDPGKIADAFNVYFTSINATTVLPDYGNLATSQSELDILLQDFVNSHIPPSSQDKFCIPPITKEIVEADLSKIPSNKATGLDGISVRVLKEALPVISSRLALIYNASISNGVFPAAFKIAKVLPLHKKDSTQERGNYRPISVLSILSKPLERHIASAYLQYLTSNNLLYSNQSTRKTQHKREAITVPYLFYLYSPNR